MTVPPVVLVAGYGKFPQNTSAEQLHAVLAVVARVDTGTHEILDVSTTLLTRVAGEFVAELLRGANLLEDEEQVISRFHSSYFGRADRGIVAAFRDLAKRYRSIVADTS